MVLVVITDEGRATLARRRSVQGRTAGRHHRPARPGAPRRARHRAARARRARQRPPRGRPGQGRGALRESRVHRISPARKRTVPRSTTSHEWRQVTARPRARSSSPRPFSRSRSPASCPSWASASSTRSCPRSRNQLHASPSETTLLFTSYLVVTAVAMLITNWVSSRIGAKWTLICGLILIVAFAALAGSSGSISEIIGFRAGWGVGNALFIATSLAVIVASASGGFSGAIVLYETALGLGIAVGPLVGGTLGEISWRGPFYGVSVLMAIALIATVVLVEKTPKPAHSDEPRRAVQGAAAPRPAHHGAHRALLQLGLLHHPRLRAVPDGAVADQAGAGVLRLGPLRRAVRRVRRAAAAGPLRHRQDHVREPVRLRAADPRASRSGRWTSPC